MRVLLVVLICLSMPILAAAQDAEVYRINPGDLLNVSVWGEDALDREVLVRPDGMIDFPLVGEMVGGGHTTNELANEIAERLERYIPGAVVTVAVLQAAGNKIFVLGEVRNPGEFQITRPLDVMQALSLAGGLTAFADQSDILVLRREGDLQTTHIFPYDDVKRGDLLETNIRLRAGDVIVVPGTSLF